MVTSPDFAPRQATCPPAPREELLADVGSHIAEARGREPEETDATVLNILDRLGDPAVVVAEARERLGIKAEPAYRPGLLEIAAIVLLPFIWVIGVILLWMSPAWKVRDKIIGSVLGAVALIVLFLLPVLTAGYLAFRLRWGRRLQAAAA